METTAFETPAFETPAFKATEAAVPSGANESAVRVEAVSSDETSSETNLQASGTRSKALEEETGAATALENQSSNCTAPSRQEVFGVDYGGGVCFKKRLVGAAASQVASASL